MKIEAGKRVHLHVHLARKGGAVIEDGEVAYIHGSGKMLPGLEALLAGLEVGTKKDGVLRAEEAFGDRSHSPSKRMNRRDFPAGASLKRGERFAAKGANGADVVLLVEGVQGDDIDVRWMHPLAEEDIVYRVEVTAVTDPAPPPLPAEALHLEEV